MNKTTNKRRRRSRPSGRRSGGSRSFRSWPALLLGGVLIVVIYVAIFYHFFVSPLSFRWRAIYGEPDYPSGYDIMGIDISHHQDNVDWDRLRNASIGNLPVQFVVIKATEGETLIDQNFNENFYRAGQNDIIRGAYHYFKSNKNSTRQAEFFLKQVHLQEGDLPPILDVEERGNKPLAEFQRDVLNWLEIVQSIYGVAPIIYTGYKFKVDYLNTKAFDDYPLWIAHYYEKELKYQGRWMMWQYTDCGRVDGVKGSVDLNIFNGSMKDLVASTLQPDLDEPEE